MDLTPEQQERYDRAIIFFNEIKNKKDPAEEERLEELRQKEAELKEAFSAAMAYIESSQRF